MKTETTLMEPGSAEHASSFHLLVMSPDALATYPLVPGTRLMLGRSASATVRLDEPKVSRHHATIHVADQCTIEDLGSSNGTRLNGAPIGSGKRIAISPGQAIEIGNSVLVVLRQSSDAGPRRLWSHLFFQKRLEEECKLSIGSDLAPAVVRVRLEDPSIWNEVLPLLVTSFPPPHLLGSYAPSEYEVMLVGKTYAQSEAIVNQLSSRLQVADLPVRLGMAAFPRDGLTVEALVGEAGARLRDPPGAEDAADRDRLSSTMSPVLDLARRAAQSNINVLLLGETGVGKEVMTKFIHSSSPRSERPLFCVNCASIQENLLESELFGHERGAFTGAVHAKVGIFEAADGGTVFLDEIGELPMLLQAKLLRVLEVREVTRVGALKPRPIDVRFVAATNRNLERDASEGRFRQDLFFRLNGLALQIPPLRDRRSEVEALARQFLAEASRDLRRVPELTLSRSAIGRLEMYDWPGNIRELKNIVERAAVLCVGGQVGVEHLPAEKFDITPDKFADERRRTQPVAIAGSMSGLTVDDIADVEELGLAPLQLEERATIIDALNRCAGNQTRVAELLGMPRRTLVFKLKAYRIPRPRAARRGKPSASSSSHE